jgi:hypothetical protein
MASTIQEPSQSKLIFLEMSKFSTKRISQRLKENKHFGGGKWRTFSNTLFLKKGTFKMNELFTRHASKLPR